MAEKLLRLVGPVHIAAGLLLFGSAFSPPLISFLQTNITGSADYEWSTFFATVLGPTIASWGVLFTALAHQFQASPTARLWRAMLLSVVVWAPLDTALCLKFEIYIGVIINSIVFVTLIALLYAVRKTIR